jgi:hypothetical protein
MVQTLGLKRGFLVNLQRIRETTKDTERKTFQDYILENVIPKLAPKNREDPKTNSLKCIASNFHKHPIRYDNKSYKTHTRGYPAKLGLILIGKNLT